jgi:predicted flap endonuclease-1-like 5' DNA nuclease
VKQRNGIILALAALLAGLALIIIRRLEDMRQEEAPAAWRGREPGGTRGVPETQMYVVEERTAAERREAVQQTAAAEEQAAVEDNLRRIEGIGPKTEAVLRAAGIKNFSQLAETSVEELERILGAAGMPPIVSPVTWPEQARLAAAGEWEKLTALQNTLKAGRRREGR